MNDVIAAGIRLKHYSTEPAACGFADQSHMTTAFKARFNITPAVFRRGVS